MPLYLPPNQPYFPDPRSPNPINCDGTYYCFPIQDGDEVYVQLYQTPCGLNLIEDPDFDDVTLGTDLLGGAGSFTGGTTGWSLGAGWAYGTNNVVKTAGASTSIAYGSVGMVLGEFYRITFTIARTAGSMWVELGVGSQGTVSGEYFESGTYTVDLMWQDTLDDTLAFFASADFAGTLDSVTIQNITYNQWNPDQFFDLSNGVACKTNDVNAATLEETVADYLIANDPYQLKFTISNYVSGGITPFLSSVSGGQITANGDYILYITPTTTGVASFQATSDFVGCISGLELYLLKDNFSFILETIEGDSVANLATYVTYYHEFVTLKWNPAATFEAGEIDYGCYRIKIFDECEQQYGNLVANPEFEGGVANDVPDWLPTVGAASQYDFDGGLAAFTYGGLVGQATSTRIKNTPNPLFIDGTYRATIVITGNTDPANIGVRAYLGSTTAYLTTVGTHTYDFSFVGVPSQPRQAYVDVEFNLTGSNLVNGTLTLESVDIIRLEPFIATFESECLHYEVSHANTRLIRAWCEQPAFNLEFENTDYYLQQRVMIRSLNPVFKKSKIIGKYGTGDAKVTYAESEKYWELATDYLSETAHACLSTQIDCTHFAIQNASTLEFTEYVVEPDDYSPEWRAQGDYPLAPISIQIRPKEDGMQFNRPL